VAGLYATGAGDAKLLVEVFFRTLFWGPVGARQGDDRGLKLRL
jgi:hypothetical protein